MVCFPPLISEKGVALLTQNRQFQYFSNPSYIFPVIPAYAATMLKESGFEVSWLDAIASKMSYPDFYSELSRQKPGIMLLETKTPVVKRHWKIIEEIKKILPETKIAICGDHITALPEETMLNSQADFAITGGDFDFSFLEICRFLEGKGELPPGVWHRKGGKIVNTGNFKLNHDLNSLPFIDRELTRHELYNLEYNLKGKPFEYIMAGRDCPYHKCRFCSWTTLFPAFRARKPENVLDEIGFLIEKYKVREIFDDSGTFPPGKWLEDFCNGMIERGYNKKIFFSCNMRVDYLNRENVVLMKKAGFRLLKAGLESGNQKTLDRLDKGTTIEQIENACLIAKKAGLEIHLTVMVGYPWETKEDAERTYALTKKLMTKGLADIMQATVIIPYPGTPLYKEAVEEGWLLVGRDDYEQFDMGRPILKAKDMSSEEVTAMCGKIYGIFLEPGYILHTFLSIRSFADLAFATRGVKAVFGHLLDFKS